MQVLDISNIAKIFSYHIYNSIQDSTLDIKKYDRWFAVGWRSGNSEINELGLNFLEAYFKDKGFLNHKDNVCGFPNSFRGAFFCINFHPLFQSGAKICLRRLLLKLCILHKTVRQY